MEINLGRDAIRFLMGRDPDSASLAAYRERLASLNPAAADAPQAEAEMVRSLRAGHAAFYASHPAPEAQPPPEHGTNTCSTHDGPLDPRHEHLSS